MRLWSLHPRYLDARGLVAVWREALLAQAVLKGRTRGYTHHPQLRRFRETRNPVQSIAAYLRVVHNEAMNRGYNFDGRKIGHFSNSRDKIQRMPVTRGQLRYEWKHLQLKLKQRHPKWLASLTTRDRVQPSPFFRVIAGAVETWEKRRL
jgi:hypothetical protein